MAMDATEQELREQEEAAGDGLFVPGRRLACNYHPS